MSRLKTYIAICVQFTMCTHFCVAGDFGEHKLIGDSAFKLVCIQNKEFSNLLFLFLNSKPLREGSRFIPKWEARPNRFYKNESYIGQFPILIQDTIAFTYGDLTALSGDHSPDFLENYRLFTSDPSFNSTGEFLSLFADLFYEYNDEMEDLRKGNRGFNPKFYEFIKLSIVDKSHFHLPATTQRKEIEDLSFDLYYAAYDNFMSEKIGKEYAAVNKEKMLIFFKANCTNKYTILHTMAKTFYIEVLGQVKKIQECLFELDNFNNIQADDVGEQKKRIVVLRRLENAMQLGRKYLLLTLFTNAFSEHYLQDMFASGHFFTDRRAPDFFALEAKGVHDFFGRKGVSTKIDTIPIHLYGDGKYDSSQVAFAILANVCSIKDLLSISPDSDTLSPMDDYRRLIESSSKDLDIQFPALAKVPVNPVGSNYSNQRQYLGRSLSGSYIGVSGIAGKDFSASSLSIGLNYLFLLPNSCTSIESEIGIGLNAFYEEWNGRYTSDRKSESRALGVGMHVLLFDWLYLDGACTIYSSRGSFVRFEQSINIKPVKWNPEIRIGLVEYSEKITPYPQLCLTLVHN